MSRPRLAPLLGVLVAAPLLAACSGDPPGQLMVVVQTDMSVPKDVDAIRIQVVAGGQIRHDQDYAVGASPDEPIPASIGILVNEDDPSLPVQIRVASKQQGVIRTLREARSTVPEDRVATLRMPVQWLCDGSGGEEKDDPNDPLSGTHLVDLRCPDENETCIGGTCQPVEVGSADLDTYDETLVFGGGKATGGGACFDTGPVFDGGEAFPTSALEREVAGSDLAERCVLDIASLAEDGTVDPDLVNVGLMTEGTGICGARGCYVPLDAGAAGGFGVDGNLVVLPTAVCDLVEDEPRFVGVAVRLGVGSKGEGLPTCGPWSVTGLGADAQGLGPKALIAGQTHPNDFVIDGEFAYFVNTGTLGGTTPDGAVKRVALATGVSEVIASGLNRPRGVAVFGDFLFWTEAGSGLGQPGSVASVRKDGPYGAPSRVQSLDLGSPEGVLATTFDGQTFVYVAAGSARQVVKYLVGEDGAIDENPLVVAGSQSSPYRFAKDPNAEVVYWVNTGTAGDGDGSVYRVDAENGVVAFLENLESPRGIFVDGENVYVTFFSATDGSVRSYPKASPGATGTVLSEPDVDGLELPSGVTADDAYVYWTNRGGKEGTTPLPGRVRRYNKTTKAVDDLATFQQSPAAITRDPQAIYWISDLIYGPDGDEAVQAGRIVRQTKP